MTWWRNGRSTKGTSGLGMVSVSGRMRAPPPPPSTTAFTSVLGPSEQAHLGSPPKGQPCQGTECRPPPGRAPLHEVLVDAARVLDDHPARAVAAGGHPPDVEHLQLGR